MTQTLPPLFLRAGQRSYVELMRGRRESLGTRLLYTMYHLYHPAGVHRRIKQSFFLSVAYSVCLRALFTILDTSIIVYTLAIKGSYLVDCA